MTGKNAEKNITVLHYVNEGNLAWAQPWMQLLDVIRSRKVDNIILCPEEGTLSSIARENNFEVHHFSPFLSWVPALCPAVGKIIQQVQPNVIHTRLSSAASIGGYWGNKLHIPVIATIDKYPRKKYYVHVDHLVGCSTAVSSHMIDQGFPQKKISTIHNPVRLDKYKRDLQVREEFRDQAGIREDQIIVLGAGRFVDWKAFHVLIKAVSQMKSTDKWVLWLVGDGPERQHLEALVDQYNIRERTVFWGFASDIRPYLWAADLFVQPSNKPEGFSLMLIEAMAAGLPAIATSIGGTLDILEDGYNGWLVEPDEINGLSEVISSVIRDTDLVQTGLNAFASAARFSIELIADEYIKLYKRWGN